MRRRARFGCLALLALATPLAWAGGDDDLDVVKRATADRQIADARQTSAQPVERAGAQRATDPKPETDRPDEQRARTKTSQPRWLKVRITSKQDGERVSLNLPLGLLRVLGDHDEFPVRVKRDGRRVTLDEILAALDSGDGIVEIEDGEGSVKIWIE